MRIGALALAVATMVALAGCGTSVRTFSEADPAFDFAKARTYAWRGGGGAAEQAGSASPEVSALTLQAIRTAIETELAMRGMQPAPEPNVLLAVRAGSRDRLRTTFWGRDPFFYGSQYGRNPPWPITDRRTVDTYEENLIAVDMFDARTSRPVWSGIGATTLPLSTEDRESLEAVVAEVLRDFPPAPGQ